MTNSSRTTTQQEEPLAGSDSYYVSIMYYYYYYCYSFKIFEMKHACPLRNAIIHAINYHSRHAYNVHY